MDRMKPTADELKDKPEEVRCLISEELGWTCVSRSYLTGLPPHRKVEQYSTKEILRGYVPIEELPNWPDSHDACRTFLKALNVDEQVAIAVILSRMAGKKRVFVWQLEPIDFCLAFLEIKGAINP